MEQLKQKRSVLKGTLTKFQSYLDKLSSDSLDKVELKLRIARNQNLLDKFDNIQMEIELLDAKEEDTSERSDFDDKYFRLMARAEKLLNSSDTSSESCTGLSTSFDLSSDIKLPTIKIPVFTGSYDEWLTFRDTYSNLIHENVKLSDIQKFHYLRTSLEGDALELLHSIETAAENYNMAWNIVKERYENKEQLIYNHMKALFELPSISKANQINLRQFSDKFQKHIRSLTILGEPTEHWDTLLLFLATEKLDFTTRREWKLHCKTISDGKCNMKHFHQFLNEQCNFLESLHRNSKSQVNNQSSHPIKKNSFVSQEFKCPICHKPHNIFACKRFLDLNVKDRNNEVNKLKLCFNCLKSGHRVKNCTASHCKKCNKHHNTLLHPEKNEHINENSSSDREDNHSLTLHSNNNTSHVLLSTALIDVCSKNGKRVTCRVLLDSASQSNFITKEACQTLNIKPSSINMSVKGINSKTVPITQSATVTIRSKFNSFSTKLECLVVPKITENIPLVNINIQSQRIPSNIQLADPGFNKSSKIDLLIGAELFYDLLSIGQIKLSNHGPILQKTRLGWIISGKIKSYSQNNEVLCNLATNQTLQKQIKAFWEIEEVPETTTLTMEEQKCETLFVTEHSVRKDGRFIVKLPFNEHKEDLGNSKHIAIKRFYSIERKFERFPNLRAEYIKFMQEYINLGHMSIVKNDDSSGYYLPHHAVHKEDSLTTKLRVVFDGSAKTSSGLSLNDALLKGPTIQQDIISILLRFRTHNYAITADIEKMYRQIIIHDDHKKYQKIVWRENRNSPLQTYMLQTVTYGTKPAPFLAVRVLNELASNHCDTFSTAAETIQRDFYVDDLLTGAESVEKAKQLISEITNILHSGGFHLHKWRANMSLIEDNITHNQTSQSSYSIPSDKIVTSKTLGVCWNSEDDCFQYSFHPQKITPTKRSILSTIAKLFDPLGLLAPVLVIAKTIMQELWRSQIDWDEPVSQVIHSKWINFCQDLQNVEKIIIPRQITNMKNYDKIQLHGFCDASESAYGACIYVRTLNSTGQITARLLCAKSRVAPLKLISLPRLELCAALLLTRLKNHVISAFSISIQEQFYWTDSTVAISWISSPSKQWKTFVGNRVSEIQSHTCINQWRHISTKENPADLVSRGVLPKDLINNSLWWNGPAWLCKQESEWPVNASNYCKQSSSEIYTEQRKIVVLTTIATDWNIIDKYSSLQKLKRIVAYIKRFVNNIKARKNKTEKTLGPLKVEELQTAFQHLLKMVQKECFPNEIKDLQRGNMVAINSKLRNLSPFISQDGLIRVGGRLNNASISSDHKNPIVIPGNHKLTILIIRAEHESLLHAGPQAVLASLRTYVWPLAGRNAVRHVTQKCITCFKNKPASIQPIMGNLPAHRITESRPFENVGVDYCGPIKLKETRRRGRVHTYNSYIAVFVCLATKAVHLEIVLNLTTESFLAALRRFISRRGQCKHIYSDNATNFTKANKDLQEVTNLLSNKSHWNLIETDLANQHIQWHFIPPRSPHFGGLWEAAVKSLKYHLRRITANSVLTYEEHLTLLVQIESCLNSRPLIPLSNNPNDLSALTPSHFLLGDSLKTPVEPNYTTVPVNNLSRWHHIQMLRQHFWNRWHREYLSQLQQRNKWSRHGHTQPQPGDLVILKEDNLPPNQWRLGRIIQVFPGKDNIIRVVEVRTQGGSVKRAVHKVCVLPIE